MPTKAVTPPPAPAAPPFPGTGSLLPPLAPASVRPAVRERAYELSFDGGVTWERCTRLTVEKGISAPVFRALRSGRVVLVQNKRGMQYRRVGS